MNNHKRIMELYWEAKKLGPPNNKLCSLVIRSCGKNLEVEKAFLVYKELLAAKKKPDAMLLESLLYACSLRKDYFKEAFGVLSQLESCGFKPSSDALQYLLIGCAKNGDFKTATILWDELIAVYQHIHFYLPLIRGAPSDCTIAQMLYVISKIETRATKTSKKAFFYDLDCKGLVSKAAEIYQTFVIKEGRIPTGHILSAYLAVAVRNHDFDLAHHIFNEEFVTYKLERHSNVYESMFCLYHSKKMLLECLNLRSTALSANISLTFQSYCQLIRCAVMYILLL